jgi:hypothetical protein
MLALHENLLNSIDQGPKKVSKGTVSQRASIQNAFLVAAAQVAQQNIQSPGKKRTKTHQEFEGSGSFQIGPSQIGRRLIIPESQTN